MAAPPATPPCWTVATGGRPSLPGPAPKEGDKFPPNKTYKEIPIAIQDRSFNADGSLFYPDTRAFFDEYEGPYLPDTDISPIWNPEFFGNTIIVNGNTWPFQTVEQCRYRFRVLNGCQSRFLILDFNKIPGVEVWAIGNEGGFLAAPVNLTAENGNRLLMGLAERADLIVDFTNVPVGNYVLGNVGPDEPFGGGLPDDDFDRRRPRRRPARSWSSASFRPSASTHPRHRLFLKLPAIAALPPATVTRPLAMLEQMSMHHDGPAEAMLGMVDGDPNSAPGEWMAHEWMHEVTENPTARRRRGMGALQRHRRRPPDAHPQHRLRGGQPPRHRIVDEEAQTVQVVPGSTPTPAEPWETGVKDTVIAYPGQVTRVRTQFNTPGQFVWHCHIVEHEDNEMMRPFRVGPTQLGQPE